MLRSVGRTTGILLIVCSFLLPLVLTSDDWPMAQHDASRTGYNPEILLTPPLVKKWVYKETDMIFDSLSSAKGTIYLGGMGHPNCNKVCTVDSSSGEKKWEFTLEAGGGGSMDVIPAIWNDLVFMGGQGDDKLYALYTENGQKAWEFSGMETMYCSDPVVVKGVVYAKGQDTLYALNASTGEKKWEFPIKGPGRNSPAVVDDTVYIGSSNGVLYAIDSETGIEKWSQPNSSKMFSCPLVSNGVVYIDASDSMIKALDANTGSLKWKVTLKGESIEGGFALYNDILYVRLWEGVNGHGKLYALDALTGSKKWFFDTEGEGVLGPVVGDRIVYVCGWKSETIYALDAITGIEKWHYHFDETPTALVLADNALYVTTYIENSSSMNGKLCKFVSTTPPLVDADNRAAGGYNLFSQEKYSEAKSEFEKAQRIYVEANDKEKAAEMHGMINKCNEYITGEETSLLREFKILDVEDYYNGSHMRYRQSFLTNEWLEIHDIPFKIKLAGNNVVHTTVEGTETIEVDIHQVGVRNIYVIGFGTYLAEQFGHKSLYCDNINHFSFKIIYRDGSVQEEFPTDVILGRKEWADILRTEGAVASFDNAFVHLFKVSTNPNTTIDYFAMVDKHQKGEYVILAATLEIDVNFENILQKQEKANISFVAAQEYFERGDYENAITYAQNAKELYQDLGNEEKQTECDQLIRNAQQEIKNRRSIMLFGAVCVLLVLGIGIALYGIRRRKPKKLHGLDQMKRNLDEMFEKGLITEKEYNIAKKEIQMQSKEL